LLLSSLAGFPVLSLGDREGLKDAINELRPEPIIAWVPAPQLESLGQTRATSLATDLMKVRISSMTDWTGVKIGKIYPKTILIAITEEKLLGAAVP
jgi:hypothetical protein